MIWRLLDPVLRPLVGRLLRLSPVDPSRDMVYPRPTTGRTPTLEELGLKPPAGD
jgi:hypothetical protein